MLQLRATLLPLARRQAAAMRTRGHSNAKKEMQFG